MRRADSSGVSVLRGGATARKTPDLSATGDGGRPLPGLRLPSWALLLPAAASLHTRSGLGRLVLPYSGLTHPGCCLVGLWDLVGDLLPL